MYPSHPTAWPTLRSWLGDNSGHPLRELVQAADGGSEHAASACARWDDLLGQIEHARPERWQGKRREFRAQNTFRETLSARSELVLAASLVRAGVKFEFGTPGQPQPDLVLPEWGLGIEVGSRVVDGVQQLVDEISAVAEAGHEPEHVEITFDSRPLAIREKVRDAIVDMFRRGQEVDEEVLPARHGQPAVRVRITRTPSFERTVVEPAVASSLLTPHQQDIEAEIRSKVIKESRKVKQGKSMPTVLVIDVARCGFAWLRPFLLWERTVQGLLDEHDPYVGVAVMVSDLGDNAVRLAWAASPHCDPELAQRVRRLFVQLST